MRRLPPPSQFLCPQRTSAAATTRHPLLHLTLPCTLSSLSPSRPLQPPPPSDSSNSRLTGSTPLSSDPSNSSRCRGYRRPSHDQAATSRLAMPVTLSSTLPPDLRTPTHDSRCRRASLTIAAAASSPSHRLYGDCRSPRQTPPPPGTFASIPFAANAAATMDSPPPPSLGQTTPPPNVRRFSLWPSPTAALNP